MLQLVHGTVDLDTGEALLGGVPQRFTAHELTLLKWFVDRPGQAVSRDELLVEVLGYAPTTLSRAADTAVARLRRKIEPDPGRPVHLLTVFGVGYRFEPAPDTPVAVAVERRGLPAERTPFLGREALLDEVLAALAAHRLVTLVGPAGAGKTRLAVAVAGRSEAPRVVYVPLRAAWTSAEALGRIGEAFGLSGEDTRTPAQALAAVGRRLAPGGTLLVLDNAEQLEDLGPALEALTAGRSSVLVTSRRPTGAAGEHVLRVGGLSAEEALRLWSDRAEAVGAATDPEDPDLAALLAELDHLPLAIELAAARARALSPSALLQRLSDRRLRLLSGGPRDADPRAHSLAAALDGSWDLLPSDQREVLARVSVFVTPFSDEAAAAVAGPGAPEALAALERASLCSRGPGGSELLRSVQAWAWEKAEALGVRADAEIRHGRWAVAATPRPAETFAEVARVSALVPELLAACHRLERLEPSTAAAAALAPYEHFHLRGPLEPCLRALDVAERVAPDALTLARALRMRANMLRLCGESARALADVKRAIAVLPERRGVLLVDLGTVLSDLGRSDEALRVLDEAVAVLPEGGDRVHAEHAWLVEQVLRDEAVEDLEARFRRCVAQAHLMNERMAAVLRGNFGAFLVHLGALEEAEAVLVEAERALSAAGAPRRQASMLLSLGEARYRRGRREEGAADVETAIELFRREGHLRLVSWALSTLASFRVADRDEQDALQLLDEADEVAVAVRDGNAEHTAACWRAVALARLGRQVEADEALERARALSATLGAKGEALLRVAGAHVALARGDRRAADAVLADPPRGSNARFLVELLRAWA